MPGRDGSEPMLKILVTLTLLLQTPAAVAFRLESRVGTSAPAGRRSGPRPAGSPAIEQSRKYIKDQLAASGVTVAEQAWDDQTPVGTVHMINLVATIPGAQQGPPGHRRPLRHEAVPRIPVRRRERRRIERGVPDRAGARAESAPQPVDDRAAVSGRRRSGHRMAGQRSHLRQPPLRRQCRAVTARWRR